MVRVVTLLILVNACGTAGASAQSITANVLGRYQQLNWQERDGLPQNTVLAIAPTRDGYLWLATYEGAIRFDGVRFTLFNPSTTTGIGNSFVTALLERRDGDLWLATYGGGVSRFSGGRFTQYATREGLSSDLVWCLFEDGAGTLWIGTDGGGVNAFRQGRFTTYTVADGLPSNLVRSLVDDGKGGLLVGTNRGMARISNGRVTPFDGPADVARADVATMALARDGSYWVATMSGRLHRVDAHGATAFGANEGWSDDRVESLFADDEGRIWVGTASAGLLRYGAGRFERYTPADGLPGARVPAITRGSDNGLWLGTDVGLVRLRSPRVSVYTRRDGLAHDFVGSIVQDTDGGVWAETGLGLTHGVNGTFTPVTARDGLPNGRLGLAPSATGFPFVYTGAGLRRWTRDRFVEVEDVAGVPWDRVSTVLEDRTGTLWIGIRDGGLIRVRDGHLTQLTTKDGLADDSVQTLFEDGAGNIWVGTLRNGATRIAGGQMTSWSIRDGLAANHVRAFHQDAAGTVWIATHGGGVSRFKDGRLASISVRQGLYNDSIFQILEDGDGNLWMNGNTGIWRTSMRQLNEVADGRRTAVESFAYGTADGMLSSEGVGATLAGSKMRDGSLWFPTTRGIVAIDPRRRDTAPARVVIEGMTVDRQPVSADGPIRLTPGQENVEIQYTGLNWSRPQAIKFRYQLVGLDREWVDAGGRRTAYYSHLPPGSYTFNLTADNGEGVWNATSATMAIVVLPAFHQTWWFRLSAVSGLVALVWLSWRSRIAKMHGAQAAQQAFSRQLIESQERERQRIAAELHDSLGQNLLVVKNRALLGALTQQDTEARRQFDEIGATAAHALEEVRAIAFNLRPHHLDQLGLTTTIRATVERMAESAGMNVTCELDDLDGLFAPADEITIYRIIQEGLNNVVKHSGADRADVVARRHAHHVEIAIRDDGRGFAAGSATGDATGEHRRGRGPAADREHGGFGLKGLAERVHMLGGSYSIESAPGLGTTVTVRIEVARGEAGHGE